MRLGSAVSVEKWGVPCAGRGEGGGDSESAQTPPPRGTRAMDPWTSSKKPHARLAHFHPLQDSLAPNTADLAHLCIAATSGAADAQSAVRYGPQRCLRVDGSHGVDKSHLELAGDR
jgi:hypothetical protein